MQGTEMEVEVGWRGWVVACGMGHVARGLVKAHDGGAHVGLGQLVLCITLYHDRRPKIADRPPSLAYPVP